MEIKSKSKLKLLVCLTILVTFSVLVLGGALLSNFNVGRGEADKVSDSSLNTSPLEGKPELLNYVSTRLEVLKALSFYIAPNHVLEGLQTIGTNHSSMMFLNSLNSRFPDKQIEFYLELYFWNSDELQGVYVFLQSHDTSYLAYASIFASGGFDAFPDETHLNLHVKMLSDKVYDQMFVSFFNRYHLDDIVAIISTAENNTGIGYLHFNLEGKPHSIFLRGMTELYYEELCRSAERDIMSFSTCLDSLFSMQVITFLDSTGESIFQERKPVDIEKLIVRDKTRNSKYQIK